MLVTIMMIVVVRHLAHRGSCLMQGKSWKLRP